MKILIFCWKEIQKQLKIKQKKKNGGFLGILSGTLGTSLLGVMLAGKGIVRAGYQNKKGKRMLRAGYGSKKIFGFHLNLKKFSNPKILSKWT